MYRLELNFELEVCLANALRGSTEGLEANIGNY